MLPLRLAPTWTLFVDDALDEEDAEKLRARTDRLVLGDGRVLEGRTVLFDNGRLDLGVVLGARQPAESRAVLVTTFDADDDGIVRIGAGADWWFDCFVNGAYVYGTASTGNDAFPVAPENHVFSAPARRGENLLVLFVESGSAGWSVACGPVAPTERIVAAPPDSRISPRRDAYRRMRVEEAAVLEPAYEAQRRRHAERRRLLDEHFAPAARVLHGPWLMEPGPGAVTIGVVTDGPVAAGVDYRLEGAADWTRRWDLVAGQARTNTAVHRIRLDGLREGARYEYRVVLLKPGEENVLGTHAEVLPPEVYSFTAFTARPRPFRFFVVGDTQFSPRVRNHYLRSFLRDDRVRAADFLVHVGDAADQFADFAGEYFYGFLDTWIKATGGAAPFVPLRGNHEYWGRESGEWFRYFGRSYGGFRMGDVYFLVLDSGEDDAPRPYEARFTGRTMDPEGFWREQRAWLEAEVDTPAFRDAAFRVVLAHGAPYGQGHLAMSADMRRLTDDLFRGAEPAHRLHLWLSGHIHVYRRTVPLTRRVQSMVDPVDLEPFGDDYSFTVMAMDGPGNGGLETSGLLVSAETDGLLVEAMGVNGDAFDRFRVAADGRVTDLFAAPALRSHEAPAHP